MDIMYPIHSALNQSGFYFKVDKPVIEEYLISRVNSLGYFAPSINELNSYGYDAIIQYDLDFFNILISEKPIYFSLLSEGNKVKIPFVKSSIDSLYLNIINDEIAKNTWYGQTNLGQEIPLTFDLDYFTIEISNPKLQYVNYANNQIIFNVIWDLELAIYLLEGDSYSERNRSFNLPMFNRDGSFINSNRAHSDIGRIVRKVELENSTVIAKNVHLTRHIPSSLNINLNLDFTTTEAINIQKNTTSKLSNSMLNYFNNKLLESFIGYKSLNFLNINLVSSIADYNSISSLTFIDCHLKLIGGEKKTLSVCIVASENDSIKYLISVRSFLSDKKYGIFIKSHLVHLSIKNQWSSLSNSDKLLLLEDYPINDSQGNVIKNGFASVRYELFQLFQSNFEFGSENYHDYISITFSLKVRFLSVKINGLPVSDEQLGDLLQDKVQLQNLAVFLTDDLLVEKSEFFENIIYKLLRQNWEFYNNKVLKNIKGKISTPLKSLFFIGNPN